jgi:hypothetical protein
VDESSDFRKGPRPSFGLVMPSSLRFLGGVVLGEPGALSGMVFLQSLVYRMRPLRSAYAVMSALLVKSIFSKMRDR